MEQFFNSIENKKTYEVKSLEKFLSLTPMNKSNFTEVMRHINELVTRGGKTYDLLYAACPVGKTLDAWMQGYSSNHKEGYSFLAMIYWETGEKPLKKFKYEELDEFEKKLYDARKIHLQAKKEVKAHAEKLKALIITKEAAKEIKSKITPFQKVFPNALPKESIEAVLIEQTKALKDEFLKSTEKWAKKSFETIAELGKLTYNEFVEKHKLDAEMNYKIRRKIIKRYEDSRVIFLAGFESFLKGKLYQAECHYYYSVGKLAVRLNRKGIIESKDFTIKTAYIRQNIETTIVDKNGKITRAWTIIAEGEIQQPHYRYLVK